MTSAAQELAPTPFTRAAAAPPPGLIARLFRRPLPEHAARELQTLLSQTSPIALTSPAVSEVLLKYRLRGRQAHAILVTLWSQALEAFLRDDVLNDAEHAYLLALRRVFQLSEDDVVNAEASVVHPRFREAISRVLSDGQVTSDERESLAKLGSALRMSPMMQSELFRKSATQLLSDIRNQSVSDRRLSPEEQKKLEEAAGQVGMRLPYDQSTERELARFALLWRIENGDIPEVPVAIELQRGETCHFVAHATWNESRKTTETVEYNQGVSFRIARGVYYRVGATPPQRVTSKGLTEIDRGTLYLTNKRVVFDGERRNSAIPLSNLTSFQVYADGLQLEKSTGRSHYLLFGTEVELAAVTLGRLLSSA